MASYTVGKDLSGVIDCAEVVLVLMVSSALSCLSVCKDDCAEQSLDVFL